MIGLEGGWGSGKTTVIRLLRKEFAKYNNITLFSFDAWAHEGDPLRRTYLESLVQHFQKIGWIRKKEWDEEIEILAKRQKTTTSVTTQTVTVLGKIGAFTTFFVPFSIPLLIEAFKKGISFRLCSECDPNWMFIFGAILAILPPISVLTVWGGVNIYRKLRKYDKVFKLEFLEKESTSTSVQNTSETPDPTSIEFEKCFRKLMSEALSNDGGKRQAILVLDNLDRVDEKDARAIWSTLQPFLQDSTYDTDKPYRQPWIIVPYDPVGIQQLWKKREMNNSATDKENKETAAEVASSFLDKSFLMRFEVPPLVLSNWREYLIGLLKKALPKHKEDEFLTLYNLYNIAMEHGKPPTPRELKLYVNQIGVIHRQWQDDFPLEHIACYVLLKRKHIDIGLALLKGMDLKDRMETILEPRLNENLAGMMFNVDAALGMQLLLGNPINNILINNEFEQLRELEAQHGKGFWAVLDEIAVSIMRNYNQRELANTASCLYKSNIFVVDDPSQVSRITIYRLKKEVRNVQSWEPFNTEIATGLSAACNLVMDLEFSKAVVKAVRSGISSIDIEKTGNRIDADILDALTTLIKELTKLQHHEALGEPFDLPGDAAGWCAMCTDLSNMDEHWWSLFKPQIDFKEISEHLCESTKNGEFNEKTIGVIRVTQASGIVTNWDGLIGAIESRMNADQNCPTAEAKVMLDALALIQENGYNVEQHLTRLADSGHLLHHLYNAKEGGDNDSIALILVRFFEKVKSGTVAQHPGQAGAGQDYVNTLLSGSDENILTNFLNILRNENKLGLLFEIMDARDRCAFIDESVRTIASDEDVRPSIFSPDIMMSRWLVLEDILGEGEEANSFDIFIKDLCSETLLEKAIMQNDKGFENENARLYNIICSQITSKKTRFKTWCKQGLLSPDRDMWKSELEEDGDLLTLLVTLTKSGIKVDLQQPFQDALENYADAILNGGAPLNEWLLSVKEEIFNSLDDELRKALQSELVRMALRSPNNSSNMGFLKLYGDEIVLADELTKHVDDVAGWFSDLVKNQDVVGLEFIKSVLSARTDIFTILQNKGQVKAFYQRIESAFTDETEKDDEKKMRFNEIANLLGLQPASPEKADDIDSPDENRPD